MVHRKVMLALLWCVSGCSHPVPHGATSPRSAQSAIALSSAQGAIALSPEPGAIALSSARDAASADTEANDPSAGAFEARFGGVVRDADSEGRMARIGRRVLGTSASSNATSKLSADVSYRLLNSEQLNAFSLPHRVYITVGLWRNLDNDDAIAATLAHEFAHIDANDSLRPKALGERESLGREMQADHRALAWLRAAGFDPCALARIVTLVADEQPAGWAAERVAALERATARGHESYEIR